MTGDTPTRRTVLNRIVTTGAAAIGVALAGCSGGGGDDDDGGDGGGGDGNTVGMGATSFEPDSLTVEAGTEVTWENDSDADHTVTAYDDGIPEGAAYFASGGYDSQQAAEGGYAGDGVMAPGDTYSHTFETAGEFEYFCIPHESQGMTGTITVE